MNQTSVFCSSLARFLGKMKNSGRGGGGVGCNTRFQETKIRENENNEFNSIFVKWRLCIEGQRSVKVKTESDFLFECSFYVRQSDFCSLIKIRHVMGALNMTPIKYMEKVYRLLRESNSTLLDWNCLR